MSWRDVDSASETISVAGLAPALVLDWRGVLPLAGDVGERAVEVEKPEGSLR
jgi:hypothetical protein